MGIVSIIFILAILSLEINYIAFSHQYKKKYMESVTFLLFCFNIIKFQYNTIIVAI